MQSSGCSSNLDYADQAPELSPQALQSPDVTCHSQQHVIGEWKSRDLPNSATVRSADSGLKKELDVFARVKPSSRLQV